MVSLRVAAPAALAVALAAPLSASAAAPALQRARVDGYVFVASGAPVVHARLRVTTLAGAPLAGSGVSGKNGTFALRVASAALPARFVVVSVGGRARGAAAPTLRAVVVAGGAGPGALVHVNPATTLAAEVARRHPAWSYAAAAARVKHYLRLPRRATLGRTMHWDSGLFDGAAFVRQARPVAGFTAFVRSSAAEIDTHPTRSRSFRGAVPARSKAAAARRTQSAARSADVGTTILTNIAGNVGGAVAKATIGDALSSAGLSNVANFLGLGNQSEQLAGIASQLAAVSGQLSQINTTVDAIQTGVADNAAQIAQSEYTQIMSTVAAVTDVGTANDVVLSSLTSATSFADDVATEALTLPAAGQTSPQTWCAANPSKAATACQIIIADMGETGGPTSSQIVKAGGIVDWCTANQGTYGVTGGIAPLAYYTCKVLTGTTASYMPGTKADFATIYPLAAGSSGSDGVVQSYARKLTAVLGKAAGSSAVLLTAANYSVPLDNVLDDWEARIGLLGLYQSVVDAFTSPAPQSCQVGTAAPVSLAPADCDVQRSYQLAGTFVTAPIALPDIPAGTFLSVPSGTGLLSGTASATHWWLAPEPSSCPTQTPYLVAWTGLQGASPLCSFNASTASLTDSLGGTAKGWSIPPIGDLQALLAASATPSQPDKLLAQAGLPDLSSAKTLTTLPVQAVATAYNTANLWNASAAPTLTNLGTAFGLWSSTCATTTWNTGYVSLRIATNQSSAYEIAIVGQGCSYLGLADGVVRTQCVSVSASPGIPCNAPTTPGTPSGPIGYQGFPFAASSGPLDFGHQLALLVERTPTNEQYWYGLT